MSQNSRWVDNDQVFKSTNIPSASQSYRDISNDAEKAMRTLKNKDALDLAEMLGLAPHLKEI